MSDIEFIANKIILLHEGELVKYDTPTALCAELGGKVWALELQERDVPTELIGYTISNMAREGEGIRLRIISDTKPHALAVSVPANLEEVFLFYCGEENA